MTENKRMYSFIGLCKKAGKLLCGEGRTIESLRRGRARLVIAASDASPNTMRKIRGMCGSRSVELITVGDRYVFGSAAGMEYMVIAAVEDSGFADKLRELQKGLM